MESPTLYICGQWHIGHGPLLQSINPATEEMVWQGLTADENDVNLAIESARSAYPEWFESGIETRIAFLRKYKQILEAEKNSLATTISLENGKPLWESFGEVNAMIGKVDISIDAYVHRCPEIFKEDKQRQMITRHHPHGVIAVFGPFNFPGHLPNGHIIPALLAGNTIVFKPSELTPLVAEKMIKIWEQVSLPKGVINLIQGGPDTGRMLAGHPDIDGLFFTGSWNTGSLLTQLFSKKPGKILALEMGGNNPLIVSTVTDLQACAYTTIQSAYLSSGQRCTCARRLIVPSGSLGDAFLSELIKMIGHLKIGPHTSRPEPFMGPVISINAAEKLLSAQENLKSQGGICLVEMKQCEPKSAFLSPGLIDVTQVKNRSDEELFGPILQLIRVDSFEKAIKEAANTEYGLTAGLLSDSKDEFEQLAKSLKAGLLCWNTPTTNASSALPFGGTGKSGNFRPTAYYAADYCAYPMTFMESQSLKLPENLAPGIHLSPNEL